MKVTCALCHREIPEDESFIITTAGSTCCRCYPQTKKNPGRENVIREPEHRQQPQA